MINSEYLLAMIGENLPNYPTTADGIQCFDQETHVGISHIFVMAAFRFGHSMVGNFVYCVGKGGA